MLFFIRLIDGVEISIVLSYSEENDLTTREQLALCFIILLGIAGGAVALSIERATPGEEVVNSILAMAARSLLVYL